VSDNNGNGHHKPIPFQGAGDVPILGQSVKILGWQMFVLLQCNCDPAAPMIVASNGAIATCPLCKRSRTLTSFHHNFQTNLGELRVDDCLVSRGVPS